MLSLFEFHEISSWQFNMWIKLMDYLLGFFFQHQFELSFQKVKNAKWCGLFNTQVLLY